MFNGKQVVSWPAENENYGVWSVIPHALIPSRLSLATCNWTEIFTTNNKCVSSIVVNSRIHVKMCKSTIDQTEPSIQDRINHRNV